MSAFFSVQSVFVTLLGYPMSYLEATGTLFNLWSVWLVARKSVLDDLEQRQEGFGIGVKEILERAKTAKSLARPAIPSASRSGHSVATTRSSLIAHGAQARSSRWWRPAASAT